MHASRRSAANLNHSFLRRLRDRRRYEMKAVLKTRMDEKPSVPCGALPDVRAVTAKFALRGINQRLACGALTNAWPAGH
jgi:hypothetical protein